MTNRIKKMVIDEVDKNSKTAENQRSEARKEAVKMVNESYGFLVIAIDKDGKAVRGVTLADLEATMPLVEAMDKTKDELIVYATEQMLKYFKSKRSK